MSKAAKIAPYVPDFELGEDLRNDVRAGQDDAWKSAVQDGRAHISHREAAHAYSARLRHSIYAFQVIEALVDSMLVLASKANLLQSIDQYMILTVVEFLFPQHGLLVLQAVKRRYVSPPTPAHTAIPSFRLCVRKRPLLAFERVGGPQEAARYSASASAADEKCDITYIPYDACCATLEPQGSCIALHDGKLARNGRRLSMQHHIMHADRVYSEHADNGEFCACELLPLLGHIASAGMLLGVGDRSPNRGTLICFGQTGTGKTFTMQACLRYLARFLMGGVGPGDSVEARAAAQYAGCTIYLKFYEVHGKKCYDLLNSRREVRLLADSQDNMCLRGAKILTLGSALGGQDDAKMREEHMLDCLAAALELRSAEVTERNPISSRSHAVCELHIRFRSDDAHLSSKPSGGVSEAEDFAGIGALGSIRLVDLAGSERNYETLKMSARDHQESADINTALMALKDCFRAAAENAKADDDGGGGGSGVALQASGADRAVPTPTHAPAPVAGAQIKLSSRVPFRAHLLTRVLKDSFLSPSCATTLLATVGPSPIDLTHSLNTLDHAVLMSPKWEKCRSGTTLDVSLHDSLHSQEAMERWSPEQVRIWLATCENGRFSMLQVPRELDGRGLCGLNTRSLGALFEGTLRQARVGGEGAAWVVGLDASAGGAAAAVSPGMGAGSEQDGGGGGGGGDAGEPGNPPPDGDDEGIDMGFLDGSSEAGAANASTTSTPSGVVFTSTIARLLWTTIRREQRAIAQRLARSRPTVASHARK